MKDRKTIYYQLRDIVNRYGRALENYEMAMHRGQTNRADAALDEMQLVERGISADLLKGGR
jgi:hypothetical protein